ncbi:MAG: hypothetical protein P4M02_09470 [Clostridia bacterium]|nr:hypothetical protein [Clostridia bacterium]
MQETGSNTTGYLDRIRIRSGNEAIKAGFLKTGQSSREKAAAQMNQSGLRFATLFILWPEIDALSLDADLIPRNRTALAFCRRILRGAELSSDPGESSGGRDEPTHSALKWMFLTGAQDDGLSNEFDQMMDVAASHLIRTFHDADILPELVRMIFRRNRKGYYIHDLVWALFSSRDPRILSLIARYLRSQGSKDAALAAKLLKNTPLEEAGAAAQNRGYAPYLSWLSENQPYLYFTQDGFHQSSDPTLCSVDLGAKYLCRKISPQDRQPSDSFSQSDYSHLDAFRQREEAEMALLAKYSHRLHRTNAAHWNKWMEYPIEQQIQIARKRLGGAS